MNIRIEKKGKQMPITEQELEQARAAWGDALVAVETATVGIFVVFASLSTNNGVVGVDATLFAVVTSLFEDVIAPMDVKSPNAVASVLPSPVRVS